MSEEGAQNESSRKRALETSNDSDAEDGWVGPMPSESAPIKKIKGLYHK